MLVDIEIINDDLDYSANAVYDTTKKTVTIKKNSKMRKVPTGALPNNPDQIRADLISQHIVDSNYIFVQDYEIPTKRVGKTPLSPAASVIMGRNANGLIEWKVNDNGNIKTRISRR